MDELMEALARHVRERLWRQKELPDAEIVVGHRSLKISYGKKMIFFYVVSHTTLVRWSLVFPSIFLSNQRIRDSFDLSDSTVDPLQIVLEGVKFLKEGVMNDGDRRRGVGHPPGD
ncbi:MAG: hypothetical protein Q8K86_06980 [Candidatus Nanopelagicaceae bacterium]|nr:hypothetical protein [Candidatus Nanopelagicaceae bacterium]